MAVLTASTSRSSGAVRIRAQKITVIGHADSDGAADYNLDLSRRRASTVAGYLVDRGIMPERFYVDGRGESAPIASNDTAAGKAQNRRVEILIRPFEG